MLFGVLLTRSSTYTHPALAAPARPATQSPITSSPVIVFVFALISMVAIRHMISIFAVEERTCLSCVFLALVRVGRAEAACGNGAASLAVCLQSR